MQPSLRNHCSIPTNCLHKPRFLRPAAARQSKGLGLKPSVAAHDSVLLNVESNDDGSTTFRFGPEQGTLNGHASTGKHADQPASASDFRKKQGTTNGSVSSSISSSSESVEAAPVPHHRAPPRLPPPSADEFPLEECLVSGMSGTELDHLAAAAAAAIAGKGMHGTAPAVSQAALPVDPLAVDYATAPNAVLLDLYLELCEARRLDDALHLLRECIRANRTEVLVKLKHFKFLRPAARCKAVKQAMRFIQLMPRQYVDARTYNMVISVCAVAGDLKSALHAADMLQMAGLRMDTVLYTNLIRACASVGNAERAFQLYGDMRAAGLPMEKQVYSALISACSRQIVRTSPEDRRTQLVLLERALGVVGDMKAARVMPDAAVWNALVSAAGRAGQLQRAFNVVEDMLSQASRPNATTYAALVDACARAGDQDLALRVYKKALREGCGSSLQLYSAAVNACAASKAGADVRAAMAVYEDLQRHAVEPDSAFFGALMLAAGRGGDLRLVEELQADMQAEGLKPCTGTSSALITVYVHQGRLDQATALYRQMRAAGRWPHPHALNALVNAHARQHRLGDVVSLVAELVQGGMKPDSYTFAAILHACLKADECELGMDVYTAMKQRGLRLDDATAQLLLWMCCSRIKAQSEGGGGALRLRRAQERSKLLQALQPRGRSRADAQEPGEVHWLSQAFAVYRDVISGNRKPSLRVLNLVLTCLQVPWQSSRRQQHHSRVPEGLGPLTQVFPPTPVPGGARQQKIGVEAVFHSQAINIVEEAIVSGVLPSFLLDTSKAIDLRGMPPAVAAAYACTVVHTLQRQQDTRLPSAMQHPLAFRVPPFDPTQVFRPASHAAAAAEEAAGKAQPTAAALGAHSADDTWISGSESDSGDDMFGGYGSGVAGVADARTGLGVAGALRRMRLYTREYGAKGLIGVEPREFWRWAKIQGRLADSRGLGQLPVQEQYGQQKTGVLADQQRSIRLGW